MKKIYGLLFYSIVAILSFVAFLYFLFPYNILKESLSSTISKESGVEVRINDLGISLPIGLSFSKVEAFTPKGKKLLIEEVTVSVKIFSLFLANLGIDINIKDNQKGYLNLDSTLGISDILNAGSNLLPNNINLVSKNFDVGSILDFIVALQAESPGADPMMSPILEKLSFGGKMNSVVDLSLSDSKRSAGKVAIKFSKLKIGFDPTMGVPDQVFSKSQIKGDMAQGKLSITKDSVFQSSDLRFAIGGDFTQSKNIMRSKLDMQMNFELFNVLKDNFGFLLPNKGKLKYKITGSVIRPTIR